MPQSSSVKNFSNPLQNKIFSISIASFALISVFFGFYFFNSQIFSSNSDFSNNNPTSQVYTNPNYSNLKINYDNSWKIEIATKPTGIYENILRREIILTKNNSKMIINLDPIVPTGCTPDEEIPVLAELGKFKRYKTPENSFNTKDESNDYYYSKYSFCNLDNKIKSNIQAKDAKEKGQLENSQWFKDFVKNYDTIDFVLSPYLESASPAEIKEADEIIKNSVLE